MPDEARPWWDRLLLLSIPYWANLLIAAFYGILAVFWWAMVPPSHKAMGWFAWSCWCVVSNIDHAVTKMEKENE